jgi:hypothetical protein
MNSAKRTTSHESTADGNAADLEREREREQERERQHPRAGKHVADASEPPRTTTGRMTAPKFGSATSGGGELEPGSERD